MKVYYEKSGQFAIGDTGISYTVIFNSGGTEYAQSPHYHFSYELQYPITDGWTLRQDKRATELAARSVCFIPPFAFHHFLPGEKMECKKISVKFSIVGAAKEESATRRNIETALSKITDIEMLCDGHTSYLFKLLADFSEQDYKRDAMVSNIVSTIIMCVVDCLEHSSTKGQGTNARKISDADHRYAILIEDCIAQNYKYSDLSLSSLADKICLSERQTERLCKKIFNASFTRLLSRQRMIIAQSLIEEGRYSLYEIAAKVGFDSYTGFYKCYRSFFGTSPKKQ